MSSELRPSSASRWQLRLELHGTTVTLTRGSAPPPTLVAALTAAISSVLESIESPSGPVAGPALQVPSLPTVREPSGGSAVPLALPAPQQGAGTSDSQNGASCSRASSASQGPRIQEVGCQADDHPPTWDERRRRAQEAGVAAARRLRGYRAARVHPATQLRPRVYVLVSDTAGRQYPGCKLFYRWAEISDYVCRSDGSLGSKAVFQGFPSEVEANCFISGVEGELGRRS